MSGIEIGLVVSLVILFLWNMILTIDKESRVSCDMKLRSINLEHTYSLGSYDSPNYTVHERINLLMDHLNLEIKEGEPSKTTLVKKKATKKSK